MILHERLPEDMRSQRPLPGIRPAGPGDWLRVDEAYAGQMARRDALLRGNRDAVLRLDPGAREAATELLGVVLELMRARPSLGFVVHDGAVLRADGVRVAVDAGDPLAALGHLVQQDLCLMQKRGAAHVLTGAVLCFPASWRLSEKFLRPLVAIHRPVAEYDDDLARRVQRLFDGVQVARPLWRHNMLWYRDPELFQPRSGDAPRPLADNAAEGFLRSERQNLFRLPVTGAVVFSIHTFVLDAVKARLQISQGTGRA